MYDIISQRYTIPIGRICPQLSGLEDKHFRGFRPNLVLWCCMHFEKRDLSMVNRSPVHRKDDLFPVGQLLQSAWTFCFCLVQLSLQEKFGQFFFCDCFCISWSKLNLEEWALPPAVRLSLPICCTEFWEERQPVVQVSPNDCSELRHGITF